MIISQTPFRISFFGGGTDYPAWYKEHGGSVLSTSINKYAYITCRHLPPFFEHRHRIVYSKIETVNEISKIDHPAVKAVYNFLDITEGLEIHYDGDLPARSGIGSSSTFTVGLLNTLYALRGEMKSKQELADQAIHVEQNIIKETVGSQDQIAAAFGGFNRINFLQNGKFEVKPLIVPSSRAEKFNDHLLLFFTGFSRIAETVAKSKIENFKKKEGHLMKMREMVDEAQNIFQSSNGNLDDLGKLLHESWKLKRDLSDKVSNSTLDEIYQAGMDRGALGGKILGAGGGGFILFYAAPERHQAIRQTFQNLIEVDFRFEYSGSQIILYNPGMATNRSFRQQVQAL
jgi:D-glycero-alpha-D-manno-heptose-7-phosphate kinase